MKMHAGCGGLVLVATLALALAPRGARAQSLPPEAAADFEAAIDSAIAERQRGDFAACFALMDDALGRWAQFRPPSLVLAYVADCAEKARLGPALAQAMRAARQHYGSLPNFVRNPAILEDLGADLPARLAPYFQDPEAALACASLVSTPVSVRARVEWVGVPVRPTVALELRPDSVCVFPGQTVRIGTDDPRFIILAREVRIESASVPGVIQVVSVPRVVNLEQLPTPPSAATVTAVEALTYHWSVGDTQLARESASRVLADFRSRGVALPRELALVVLDVVAVTLGEHSARTMALTVRDPAEPFEPHHLESIRAHGVLTVQRATALSDLMSFANAGRCVRVTANVATTVRPATPGANYFTPEASALCATPAEAATLTVSASGHNEVVVPWRGEDHLTVFLPSVGTNADEALARYMSDFRRRGDLEACLALGNSPQLAGSAWAPLLSLLDCAEATGDAAIVLRALGKLAVAANSADPDPLTFAIPPSVTSDRALVERARQRVRQGYAAVRYVGAVRFECQPNDVVLVGQYAYALPGTECRFYQADSDSPVNLRFKETIEVAGVTVLLPSQGAGTTVPGSSIAVSSGLSVALTVGLNGGYDTLAGVAFGGEVGLLADSRHRGLGLRLLAGIGGSGVSIEDEFDPDTGETSPSFGSDTGYVQGLVGLSFGTPRAPTLPNVLRLDVLAGVQFWWKTPARSTDVLIGGSLRYLRSLGNGRFGVSGEIRPSVALLSQEFSVLGSLSLVFGVGP